MPQRSRLHCFTCWLVVFLLAWHAALFPAMAASVIEDADGLTAVRRAEERRKEYAVPRPNEVNGARESAFGGEECVFLPKESAFPRAKSVFLSKECVFPRAIYLFLPKKLVFLLTLTGALYDRLGVRLSGSSMHYDALGRMVYDALGRLASIPRQTRSRVAARASWGLNTERSGHRRFGLWPNGNAMRRLDDFLLMMCGLEDEVRTPSLAQWEAARARGVPFDAYYHAGRVARVRVMKRASPAKARRAVCGAKT